MDITVPICNSNYGAFKRPGSTELTHSPLNNLCNTKLASLFGVKNNLKSGKSEDALQAVKQDPAVLEAQITVNTSTNDGINPKLEQELDKDIKDARFQEILSMQEAALSSLTPQQFDFLMKYADSLRRRRLFIQKNLECAFCKNNGELVSWYSSHVLKDSIGRVQCPVLRGFRCPCCGATGDRAHTIKYCPENIELDHWSRR